jgi:uncharacterized membrane protein
MLISGTLWLIFSIILLVVNMFYNELITGQNNLWILFFSFLSFLIGIFFYYFIWINKKDK